MALKLPAFGPDDSPRQAERFVREARAAAALQHPGICTIHDAGEIDGRPFLTMAHLAGKPLEAAIDPGAPMAQPRAARIAQNVALALAHAHARGIVHRDLKPANVMLSLVDEPVVMDFGLAKWVADPAEIKLTRHGAVMGTPAYMAPEQVKGEVGKIGPATDVYALGVVLFEMLTGRPPYVGPLGVLMGQILTAPVPPVSEFRRDVDPRLDAACRRAMAKEPADRFPSMGAFAQVLGDFLKDPTTPPGTPRPTPVVAKYAPAPTPPAAAGITTGAVRPSPGPSGPKPVGARVTSAQPTSRPNGAREGLQHCGPKKWKLSGPILVGVVILVAIGAAAAVALWPNLGDHSNNPVADGTGQPKGDGSPPLVKEMGKPDGTAAEPKAGEERSFEIADGVRMVFCYIPPGVATLGSPKGEPEREEDELEHEYASRVYWLGKYEVTQREWVAVMGDNPSTFDGRKSNKAKGLDTKRYPVDNVSWDDCQTFLKALNEWGRVTETFGKAGRLRLPHEDEWEYACRGGRSNGWAFYWDSILNGARANCDGESPYRMTPGPSLGRTCDVEFTDGGSYATHPWGLMHMCGNVWEWCEDEYPGHGRRRRGGSWASAAAGCRAANRSYDTPDTRRHSIGLRVCFRPG